jgi:NAD(P)-dependent dehydrogenase (short-subunit alcohol dehydrogenase family)
MSEILRAGLLDGVSVRVARLGGRPDRRMPDTLERLGARLLEPGEAGAGALVLDCSDWRDPEPDPVPGGAEPLMDLLDGVWGAVLATAVEGLIAAGRGGRLVFIAPGAGAPLAAAALENLSRSLSVEWARHSITAVTLVPASATDPVQLATVVAYLLSPAGAYLSGARLELDPLSR